MIYASTNTSSIEDELFMDLALESSHKAFPVCLPNPPVGCLIVRNGQILSEGFTHGPGQFHAEAHALSQIGDESLEGAIAYVTLEPCSFAGRTPSCARLLLERGICRVVVSLIDPDPRNDGKGVSILRDGGVDVTIGVLGKKVSEFILPYLSLPTNVNSGSPNKEV